MPTWRRCKAAMTITARANSAVEHLWPGLVVNLERELAPGFTLGAAIEGREADFDIVNDPATEEDVIANVLMDGGPAPAGFTHVDVDPAVDLSNATLTQIPEVKE